MRVSRRSHRVAGKDLQNAPALTRVSAYVQLEKPDVHRYIKDDIDIFRAKKRHLEPKSDIINGLGRIWEWTQSFP